MIPSTRPTASRNTVVLTATRTVRGFGAGALSVVLALDLQVALYDPLQIGIFLGVAMGGAALWSLLLPRGGGLGSRKFLFALGSLALAAGGFLLWTDLSNLPWHPANPNPPPTLAPCQPQSPPRSSHRFWHGANPDPPPSPFPSPWLAANPRGRDAVLRSGPRAAGGWRGRWAGTGALVVGTVSVPATVAPERVRLGCDGGPPHSPQWKTRGRENFFSQIRARGRAGPSFFGGRGWGKRAGPGSGWGTTPEGECGRWPD